MPDRKKGEPAKDFIERCMTSEEMKKEYPDTGQRLTVCISKSREKANADIGSKIQDEISYQDTYAFLYEDEETEAAEYQGKTVTLNKPFRTPDGPKKFAVYTKNEKGNVIIVRFGDPNMEIKRDNPERRKSFRARHKCDTDPPKKWTARYWSCKMW